jgi:hypothetical protein
MRARYYLVGLRKAQQWKNSTKEKTLQQPVYLYTDRCRVLYSSCGSAKHQPQQVKLWIPGSTAKLCGDCVKTIEDVAPNFGENRPGCFTMTTHRLTLPSSPCVFWWNKMWVLSLTHLLPWFGTLWIVPISKVGNWSWKCALLTPLKRSMLNRIECLTLWQKRTSRKRSKNGGTLGMELRAGGN